MKRVVWVWGKRHEITVYRKFKTVWIAVGEYMGESFEVTGRTDSQAANKWRVAARYKGA